MSITPGRLVAMLTPLVFAPLAGAIAVAAAKHFPGVDLDPAKLEEVFIAGAVIAFGKAGLWLRGWQEYERRQETLPDPVADDLEVEASMAAAGAREHELRDHADLAPEDEDELADLLDEEELEGLFDDDDELLAPAGRRA